MTRQLLVVALAVGCALFWNLSERYLWQDEAACAVLGTRLFEHGRPLGYDGTNLITMDTSQAEEAATVQERARDAASGVAYFTERGDFKQDTTWIGQPWGSMFVAGLSLELFGRSNFAARAPFALFGLATALLVVASVRRRIGTREAWIAGAYLAANVWWLLHSRQCRYYSLATFLQLATLLTYLRWQDGGRHGAKLFALCAGLWFHTDFGSFWPTLGVLGAHALITRRVPAKDRLAAFAAVGLVAASGAWYYELFGRLKPATTSAGERIGAFFLSFNQYQLPLLFLAAVPFALLRSKRAVPERTTLARDLGLAALVIVAQLVWVSAVTPFPFYRYVVSTTPLAAFALAGLCAALLPGARLGLPRLALAALVILTPLPAWTASWAFPASRWKEPFSLLRPEFPALAAQWSDDGPDPNRAVVELLRERLRPGDEILCNYEDVPLMHYLDSPVRGGLPCFRVDERPLPKYFVLRASLVQADQVKLFQDAMNAAAWRPLPIDCADIAWGNNPDPLFHFSRLPTSAELPVRVFRRP